MTLVISAVQSAIGKYLTWKSFDVLGRQSCEQLCVDTDAISAKAVELFRQLNQGQWRLLIWIEIVPQRVRAFEDVDGISCSHDVLR